MFIYSFEWDPLKAAKNKQKHHVSFEVASSVFKDPRALSRFDDDHSRDEDRWITMGMDRNGAVIVVCHTYRKSANAETFIRIFSARKATKNEIKQYGR